MGRFLGRIAIAAKGMAGHPCGECELGHPRGSRRQKRREGREAAAEISAVLRDVEYAAELPDPAILDGYEIILPGSRERLLRMRRQGAPWEEIGESLWRSMRRIADEADPLTRARLAASLPASSHSRLGLVGQ